MYSSAKSTVLNKLKCYALQNGTQHFMNPYNHQCAVLKQRKSLKLLPAKLYSISIPLLKSLAHIAITEILSSNTINLINYSTKNVNSLEFPLCAIYIPNERPFYCTIHLRV